MFVIPTHIKALIFDLDGTLADTMPIHLNSWVNTGIDLNVPITEELIIENAGLSTIVLVNKFNADFGWNLNPHDVRKIKTKHFDQIKKLQGKIKPIESIFNIAQDFRDVLPMSIGTGSSRVNALRTLEDLNATDWWVTMVTGTDDVKGKPAPDIFLECAKAMNIEPKHCLVFEDGKPGIQAAISAGMDYIDITKTLNVTI